MATRQAATGLRNIEFPNDRVRKCGELVQCYNDLPMVEVSGFIQAYLHGEINLGIRCALGDETNYGFIIAAAHPAGSDWRKRLAQSPGHETQLGGSDFDSQQALMLADNVEQMEGVKKVVPSLVRFQRFDDGLFRCGERLYEFVPFVVPCVEVGSTRSDWKVSVVNQRLAVAVGKGRGENIETAPNGVDVNASLNLERQRQRLFFDRQKDILRSIRWQLFASHVNVVFEPSIQSYLEGWELGYGPIDRGPSV